MKKMDKHTVIQDRGWGRAFWATHSPLDYFDFRSSRRASFPNLKPSLKSISIRVPSDMLAELKNLANKQDVPYQSLAKVSLLGRLLLNVAHRFDLDGKRGRKSIRRFSGDLVTYSPPSLLDMPSWKSSLI